MRVVSLPASPQIRFISSFHGHVNVRIIDSSNVRIMDSSLSSKLLRTIENLQLSKELYGI